MALPPDNIGFMIAQLESEIAILQSQKVVLEMEIKKEIRRGIRLLRKVKKRSTLTNQKQAEANKVRNCFKLHPD